MAPVFRFLTPPKGVTVHRPYFLGSRHLSYNMFRGCAIYAPNQLRSIFLFPAVSEQYWLWLGLHVFQWQYSTNRFVGYFQPLLVVAPSIPAFLEFGLVCSCSHRKAPSTLSMFWWIYCRCLHFCNFSFGLAIPFGLLHSLGLGWACMCPHGYGTSIFLVGLFIEFPISAIYFWMCSLFGGCAIYSCIFGFWLGFHVFYGNATSTVFLWCLRIYCRFSFSYIFGKTCSAFWGLRHLFLHFWVLVGFASLSMAI